MSARNQEQAGTIESAVSTALKAAGVADGSELKGVLVHDAEVYRNADYEDVVIVPDPSSGKSISLQDRLAQMRDEPRWRGEFPEKPAQRPASQQQVAVKPGTTLRLDRDSFDALASGKLKVV